MKHLTRKIGKEYDYGVHRRGYLSANKHTYKDAQIMSNQGNTK